MRLISRLSTVVFLTLCVAGPLSAQSSNATVQAVLFSMNGCPDCLNLEKGLPQLEAKYGSQLKIVKVNIMTQDGRRQFDSAMNWIGVPASQRGVPTLVIEKRALVGSQQILSALPAIVENGLKKGGIPAPAIP